LLTEILPLNKIYQLRTSKNHYFWHIVYMKRKNIRLTQPEKRSTAPDLAEFDATSLVSNIVLDVFDPSVQQITLDAPPGSGKTASIIGIVRQLVELNNEIKILIASPTRAQVMGLTRRLSEAVQPSHIKLDISIKEADGSKELSSWLSEQRWATSRQNHTQAKSSYEITVSTVAKLAMNIPSQAEYHVLIIDEAYQVKSGDYNRFNRIALKQIFVGDPGQIGPVIVANSSIWSSLQHHSPANRLQDSIVNKNHSATTSYHLPSTWRLGAETTKIVREMYDFDFDSARLPVTVRDGDKDCGEIQVYDVNHDLSDVEYAQASIKLAFHIASLVAHMLETYTIQDSNGEVRKATKSDIAVVSGYRTQVEDLELAFVNKGIGAREVSILTSDSAQGSEWPIVIAIDPLALEKEHISAHSLSPGRLTVMLSRHSAHLVWYGRHPEDVSLSTSQSEYLDERSMRVRGAIYQHECVGEVF